MGANPAADKLLGVDNSMFIGKTIEEAFPPLNETEVPYQYRKVAKEGGIWSTKQINYEDQQIKGAFEVHAFQISPGKMAAFFLEISKSLIAEMKLKESEEKFRSLFEQAGDAITIVDPQTATIIDSNTSFYSLFEYSPEEFKDYSLYNLNPNRSHDEVKNLLEEVMRKGFITFESKIRTKSGKIKYILNNSKKIDILNKTLIQTIAKEITELKEVEEKYHQAYNLAKFYKDLFAHDISNINAKYSHIH